MSRKQRIHDALFSQLKPDLFIIENESNNHQVPAGSETHFKVIIVSNEFNLLRLLARHRLVNTLLATEFNSGLHALSLHLHTPTEWQQKNGSTQDSPACHHAKKSIDTTQ